MEIQLLTNNKLLKLFDGFYADGNGLYFRVRGNGTSRSWVFRRQLGQKRCVIGLGSLGVLSLTAARKLVDRINDAIAEGIHPKDFLSSFIESPQSLL